MDLDDIDNGRDFEDMEPEEKFSVRVNLAMIKALKEDADPETLARIAENTSREIWDQYGAKDNSEYNNYLEFVVDVGFETAEIEEWLDEVEAAGLNPDDLLDS